MKTKGKQVLSIAVILFVTVCLTYYSNLAVWNGISMNDLDKESLTVGSVRKLLEEEELVSERANSNGQQKRLPQCVIIGARKCGTRALLEFLGLHPLIQPADQEVHFFDDDRNYNRGYEWYKEHMPYSYPKQITLEKSPRYFITEKAPERIHQMNSSIKLIVLLRNPTTRVISDYTQVYYNKIAKGKDVDKFEDLVIDKKTNQINTGYRAVQISIYYNHLLRWFKFFKREQVHVVDGDKLITNPLSEINKVEQFLGLQSRVTENNIYFNTTRGFYCMRTPKTNQKCLGLTKGRKHPHIESSILQKLNEFFRPYNKKLFSLINQTFDWDD